jgi:hypothetical protein
MWRCALEPRSDSDAGALGSESAGARFRRLAPSSLGKGDAGAGPICRVSSMMMIRVTTKTAGLGHETVRLPFRRASLVSAGGKRVTASGAKPAVPRSGVFKGARPQRASKLSKKQAQQEDQLVSKARRPAGWPSARLAVTVTVAQARSSQRTRRPGPRTKPPGGRRAKLAMTVGLPPPAGTAAETGCGFARPSTAVGPSPGGNSGETRNKPLARAAGPGPAARRRERRASETAPTRKCGGSGQAPAR